MKARCQVSRLLVVVVTALTVVLCVLLAQEPAAGQAFWAKDTPKLPMAKSWLVEKAKLPPFTPRRTPEGVPDLQGAWNGAGGDNNSYLEDHDYVDSTTPAQESFVSDPADGKVPYTPWALASRGSVKDPKSLSIPSCATGSRTTSRSETSPTMTTSSAPCASCRAR